MKSTKETNTRRLALAGLMAALAYVGYAFLPALSASGTKIHFGKAYLLGGLYGGLSGAVGLSIADLTGGYAESAPRTFITKLVIGLIAGWIAHRIAHISEGHKASYVTKWTAISAAVALGFNCIFEPSLKYVWYTLLTPDPEKASKAIASLMAVTTYTTVINAVTNGIAAVLLYSAIRPALIKSGLLPEIGPARTEKH